MDGYPAIDKGHIEDIEKERAFGDDYNEIWALDDFLHVAFLDERKKASGWVLA